MPRKSPNVQHGKRDLGEDEGHTSHKKSIDKDKKSPTSLEVREFKEKEPQMGPNTSKDVLTLTKSDHKSTDHQKVNPNEGNVI